MPRARRAGRDVTLYLSDRNAARLDEAGWPLSEVVAAGLDAAERQAADAMPAVRVVPGRVVEVHEALWGPCSRRAMSEGASVAEVVERALREYAGL